MGSGQAEDRFLMDRHDTVGIDLVAMCVNDIVVAGAKPLSCSITSHLTPRPEKMAAGRGIVKGCVERMLPHRWRNAEMPGFYKEGEYDVAGFVVGIVENMQLIDGSTSPWATS